MLNPTILIVDDSKTDRDTYRRYLEPLHKLGYRILDCESAEEALDLCECDRPHLILLDYLLFDLDGLEFLRQLGDRIETLPPTIMLTGHGSELVAVEAMKLGVKDYLVKRQLTAPDLINVITNILTQQKLQAQIDRQQLQQNLLSRIMLKIGAANELPIILQAAVDGVRQLLDCDRVIVCEFSPDLSGTVISQSVLPQWQPMLDLQIEQACFYSKNPEIAKYLDGQKLVVSDLETAALDSSDLEMLHQFQVKAFLAVPILSHDILPVGKLEVWGLLIAHNFREVRIWQPDELDLIDRLSIQMAIAVQQAELVSDLKIALQKQQALLDIVPVGIAIAEDANCNVIHVNGYVQKMLSVTGDTNVSTNGSEAETLPFRQYQNGKEIPVDRLPMQLASSQGIKIEDFEMQMVRADGFTQDWLINAIPLFNEAGEVRGSIAAIANVTKLIQLEAQLRQRESQLQLFVKYVPAGVAMLDRDMCYLNASDVWLDCHELSDRDIVGRSYYDLYPNLPPQWKEIHQCCLAGAVKSCEEDLFPRPDGAIDWVRWEARPWYTDTDEVVGIIMFSEIITDRKQTQQRLQESELRLRAGIEVAGVGMARFDYTTNLVLLSPEAAALYGFDPDTSFVTREQIHDTFHPDERAELEEIIAQVIDPAGIGWFARDHRVMYPNGEVRWLSVRKQVFFDSSGAVARPSYAILAAINITDRKRAESALKQSEERYRNLVELIPQLVWKATPEGVLLDVNQRWLDFTGLTLAQAKSESWGTVIYADDLPTLNQSWELAQQAGKYEAEGRMLGADGQYRWYLHQAIAEKNERGQIIKWFGTATDIDDLKQLEQQ